jgi:hypothetical protein
MPCSCDHHRPKHLLHVSNRIVLIHHDNDLDLDGALQWIN